MSDWGQFIDISPDRSNRVVHHRNTLPTIFEQDIDNMYDDFVRTNSGELFNNNINRNLNRNINRNLNFQQPIISFIYCVVYWFKYFCK